MAKFDKSVLASYGIQTGTAEVLYNPSYEVLFNEETKAGLEGFDKCVETELGAVNCMTGIYTGRSPKDKFIVDDATSHDTVWWDSEEYHNDNHRASLEAWKAVKKIAQEELSNKKLYVVDGFCGTHRDTRMKVRFIVEVAWQAHFVTNMFIRPKTEADFEQEPDFIVYNASKAKVENWKELGLHSETAVVFNYPRFILGFHLLPKSVGIAYRAVFTIAKAYLPFLFLPCLLRFLAPLKSFPERCYLFL